MRPQPNHPHGQVSQESQIVFTIRPTFFVGSPLHTYNRRCWHAFCTPWEEVTSEPVCLGVIE